MLVAFKYMTRMDESLSFVSVKVLLAPPAFANLRAIGPMTNLTSIVLNLSNEIKIIIFMAGLEVI